MELSSVYEAIFAQLLKKISHTLMEPKGSSMCSRYQFRVTLIQSIPHMSHVLNNYFNKTVFQVERWQRIQYCARKGT